MPSIASLRFDLTGWSLKQQSDQKLVWFNRIPDIIILEFYPHPVNLPVDLRNMSGMRAFVEQMVARNAGAVVTVDHLLVCDDLEAVKCIFKYRQSSSSRRSPLGVVYCGLSIFPFANFSYLIKVQCHEYGTIGLREATNASPQPRSPWEEYPSLYSKEELLTDLSEPYIVSTPTDDEKYDTSFPQHPLSRLRKYLHQIERTLTVDEGVKCAEPFRKS